MMLVSVCLLIAFFTTLGQTQFTPQELEKLLQLSDEVCDVPLSCSRPRNISHMCRCSCDESCADMAECCIDSPYLDQTTNQTSFASSCYKPMKTGKEYFVVNNCQGESACGSSDTLRNFIWMTHKHTGTIYRSEACAACHMVDQSNLVPWKVHVTGNCEHTSRVIDDQVTTAPTTTKRQFVFVGNQKPNSSGNRKKRALRLPVDQLPDISTTEASGPTIDDDQGSEHTTVNHHESQTNLFTRLENYTLDALLDMVDDISEGTESMVDSMVVSLDVLLNRLHAYDVSDCSYVMTPPVDPYPSYHECSEKLIIKQCHRGSNAEMDNYSILEQACSYFNTPYMAEDRIYKNIFCYLCNAPQTSTETSSGITVGVGTTNDVFNDVTNVTDLYSGARDERCMMANLGFLVLTGLLMKL